MSTYRDILHSLTGTTGIYARYCMGNRWIPWMNFEPFHELRGEEGVLDGLGGT